MSLQEHHMMSSSDVEHAVVPLQLIRSNFLMLPEEPEDPNSYKELYKYSMEKCEFCESIFHCRYDMIIHNAKHIIVPLINLTTYKCNICLHVFTSERDFQRHKYVKHNLATPPEVLRSFFRRETDVKHDIETMPRMLENIVRKEPVVQCDDSVNMMVKSSNLKNRLVFEDDDDDVICLDNEVPSRTNGRNFNSTVNDLILDVINHKFQQTLNGVCPSPSPCKEKQNATPKLKVLLPSQVNLEKLPPSVHYDHLIKPGLFRCKRCTKTFPNRYTHIIHETKHMKFKTTLKSHLCVICDRQIAGNKKTLTYHIETYHPLASRNRSVNVCNQCNLKFHNSARHAKIYHYIYICRYCNTRFLTSAELSTHYDECSMSYQALFKHYADNQVQKSLPTKSYTGSTTALPVKKNLPTEGEENFDILRFCEVCAMFLKDKFNIKYICIGENSKLECNQTCERCNKEAYVIKLIKRVRINMKFKGECKVRTLSNNENRLKNIQQRLKLMNKLSR